MAAEELISRCFGSSERDTIAGNDGALVASMIERLRAWARKHSDENRYTPVAIAFHWVMAALVIFQLAWGWYAGLIPVGGSKLQAYQIHSDIGLLILVLAIGRFIWRLMIPGPVNDADIPGLESTIASITHVIFYICFFGLPLSGWAMWSAIPGNEPLAVAGLFAWPALPFDAVPQGLRWAIMDWAEDVHHVLVITLTVLVPLHVAAALKHHFWNRHDVLSGMLPDIPDAEKPPAARQHKPRVI